MPPGVQALAEERAPYVLRRLPGGKVTWKYDPVIRDEYLGAEPPPYIGRQPADVWERVRCPVLFVVPEGGGPGITLDKCQELVGYGNRSRYVEVGDVGPNVHEDDPQAFLQTLQAFLDEARTTADDTAV
jgi:pimeloyl-ACP methyl ester carboxylesterase